MKQILPLAFAVLLLLGAGCDSDSGPKGIPVNESTDLIYNVAADRNLQVLQNFTGPDWCTACQALEGTILSSPAFKAKMDGVIAINPILFPRLPELRAAISPEETKRRETLLQSYKIEGLPTVVVTDPAGLPYAMITGSRATPEEYIAELDAAFAVREKRDTFFAEAETKSGLERAQKLAKALEILPKPCRDKYETVITTIIELDPENTLGYKYMLGAAERFAEQMTEFQEFVKTFQGRLKPEELKEDIGRIETYLAREDLLPEIRQMLLRTKGDCYAFLKDYDMMFACYDEAIAAAPETRLGKKMATDTAQMKAMRAEYEAAKTKAASGVLKAVDAQAQSTIDKLKAAAEKKAEQAE